MRWKIGDRGSASSPPDNWTLPPTVVIPTLGRAERFASELVIESNRGFQITNREFINAFEIRRYIHPQFVIRRLESISSQPLRISAGRRPWFLTVGRSSSGEGRSANPANETSTTRQSERSPARRVIHNRPGLSIAFGPLALGGCGKISWHTFLPRCRRSAHPRLTGGFRGGSDAEPFEDSCL